MGGANANAVVTEFAAADTIYPVTNDILNFIIIKNLKIFYHVLYAII